MRGRGVLHINEALNFVRSSMTKTDIKWPNPFYLEYISGSLVRVSS